MDIKMVDLKTQYLKIKDEIDEALISCVESTNYINGPQVLEFENSLNNYLNINYSIGCGNGTDALQISLMSLNLNRGDEVIIPAFTYVATAEAISILGLIPIMVDVDKDTFNISIIEIEKAINIKTKAIIPVHLYGQSANMEPIMKIANKYNLFVIEDNAQSFGAEYSFSDGVKYKTGTIGHIGCNSFFPTKNLGCFGDGGAITTNDSELAERCRMIASHGQKKKYQHSIIGCNSRLDTIQATILNVKLKYIDYFISNRKKAAQYYISNLYNNSIVLPKIEKYNNHTFNQFTIKIKDGNRDKMCNFLKEKGIPSMIYYPLPLYKQNAFKKYNQYDFELETTKKLCESVLSIPMHTELNYNIQDIIIDTINNFK